MRRLAFGGLVFVGSIVLPATFQGPVFLAAGWVLMGLFGLALVVTAEPVKRPLLNALRRELELNQPPAIGARQALAPGPPKRELREATGWLLEDLESTRSLFEQALGDGHWSAVPAHLDFSGWTERGQVVNALGYHDTHKLIRTAIRLSDQCAERCRDAWQRMLRGMEEQPHPDLRPTLSDLDRKPLRQAVEALNEAAADVERIQR